MSFIARRDFDAGSIPQFVGVGDLNGDGRRIGLLPTEEHGLPIVSASAELTARLDRVLQRASPL